MERRFRFLFIEGDLWLRFPLLFYLLFRCQILVGVGSILELSVLRLSFASNILMQHGPCGRLLLNQLNKETKFRMRKQLLVVLFLSSHNSFAHNSFSHLPEFSLSLYLSLSLIFSSHLWGLYWNKSFKKLWDFVLRNKSLNLRLN